MSDKTLDELVTNALKSGEWKEYKDEKTGKLYYYNKAQNKTTWDLKKTLTPTAVTAVALEKRDDPGTAQEGGTQAQGLASKPIITGGAKTIHTIGESKAANPLDPPVVASPAPTMPSKPPGDLNPLVVQQPPPTQTAVVPPPSDSFDGKALLMENKRLQQMIASGNQGLVSLDLQAKADTLQRTNNALQLELDRSKKERDKLEQAFVLANQRVHEQAAELAKYEKMADHHIESESHGIMLTLAHLRESNKVLVKQVVELSTLLARGLADQQAVQQSKIIADLAAAAPASVGKECQPALVISRFLESSVKPLLSTTTRESLERLRDSLEHSTDTTMGASPVPVRNIHHVYPGTTASLASYESVVVPQQRMTGGVPPPIFSAAVSAAPHFAYGEAAPPPIQSTSRPSPPVLYEGFLVRNARTASAMTSL